MSFDWILNFYLECFCSMSKILKCAANDDAITIKSADSADNVTFMFESTSKFTNEIKLLVLVL